MKEMLIEGYKFVYDLDLEIPKELKGKNLGLVTEEIHEIDGDGLHHKFDVWSLDDINDAIEECFIKTIRSKDLKNINLWYVEKDDNNFYKDINDGNSYSPINVKNVIDIRTEIIKSLENKLYNLCGYDNINELSFIVAKTITEHDVVLELNVNNFGEYGEIEVVCDSLDDYITIQYDIYGELSINIDVTDIF